MPPSAEAVRVVADLVTDAAEIAAAHVMDDPHQIEVALRAAAPYIAAEALRQAASEQRKQYAAHLIDKITATWLEVRADELEGK